MGFSLSQFDRVRRRYLVIVALAIAGCGGSTSSNTSQESTGGSLGATGGAGTSGSSTGGAATGGFVAAGGATSIGGSSSSGGTTSTPDGWECVRDDDCIVFGDCCGCWSAPVGTSSTCPLDCALDHCTDYATRPRPRCAFGRCTLAITCEGSVSCTSPPPFCGPGTVPTIEGNCYGPCTTTTECPSVSDCSACAGVRQACVFENGAVGVAHCVDVPPECSGNATCACMGQLCGAITPCTDLSNGISCGGG